MGDSYRPDLAYIHDSGFGGFAAGAAPGLLDLLRRSGIHRGLVIDLGCGSGIWAHELAAAGYDVLGIDQSAAMIAIARRRVPGATFRAQSFLVAELPPCAAVTAIGECFNYLFDPANTEEALHRVLGRIYNALHPGGLLIFDGAVPGRGVQRKFIEGDDWAVLVTAEEDRQRMLVTRTITSFRKVGNLYRRDHEVHRLRLFNRPQLAERLREIGFRARVVRGYGPMRFATGTIGFVARKPGVRPG